MPPTPLFSLTLSHTLLYRPIFARTSGHKLSGMQRTIIGIIILADDSKAIFQIV